MIRTITVHHPLFATAVLLLGMLTLPLAHGAQKMPVTATAFDPQTGDTLYVRHSGYSYVGDRLTGSSSSFTTADNRLIATRRSVYAFEGEKPSVELEMFDRRVKRGVQPHGSGNLLQMWSATGTSKPDGEGYVRNSEILVVDGDIERYVIEHLKELEAGKEVRARWVSLSSLRDGYVYLRKVDKGDAEAVTTVEINSSSRDLIPQGTAQLTLDGEGRLIRYIGPSELVLQEGGPVRVRLDYAY